MLLSPSRPSITGQLLRLLAVWMAVIVLLQGLAAGVAHAAGPAHKHLAPATPALLQHAGSHHHSDAARHHHETGDPSVVAQADAAQWQEALDTAAAALIAAFSLLALGWALRATGPGGRVWRAALAWSPRLVFASPPLKPPQRG